jgi:hypothetical protein
MDMTYKLPSLKLAAIALAALVGACTPPDFSKPVGDFSRSLATANGALLTYYSQMNQLERDYYLAKVAYDPSQEVLATYKSGERTGLLGYFSADSLQARADTLSLLNVYATRLAALAASTAPQAFASGTTVLGANLAKLDNTMAGLSGSGDTSAANYAGPISTLIGAIGQMYLQHEKDAALAAATKTAAPAVNKILDLLEKDTTNVIGQLQTLSIEVGYYNKNRGAMSVDERRALLDTIKASADRYETALAFAPKGLIQAVRTAHNALVAYAQSPHAADDLASLTAAIESFNSSVTPIVEAIKQLQQLRR